MNLSCPHISPKFAPFFIGVLFLLGAFLSTAQNQQVIMLNDGDSIYSLNQSAYFMEDPSGEVTIEQIWQYPQTYRFLPMPEGRSNFGNTRSAIWCKFTVLNSSGISFYWVMERLMIEEVAIFEIGPKGHYVRRDFGALYPHQNRPIASNHLLYPLPNSNDPVTYYIRFSGDQTMDLHMNLMGKEQVHKHHAALWMMAGLMGGFLLAMIIYNLFIYFSIKEKGYLIYSVILSLLILNSDMTFFGFGFQYLWPHVPKVNQYMNAIVSATFMILTWFPNVLLNTKKHAPFLYRISFVFYAFHIVVLLLFATGQLFIANITIEALGILNSLFLIVLGIVCWRRKVSGAKYFSIGWSVSLTCVIVFALYLTGVLPSNFFVSYAPLFGICFEASFFSFALAAKIRNLRIEKELAQREKLELIARQNEDLEQLVQTRTEEIATQNEEIIVQFEELENRNQKLELAWKTIEDQNEKLKSYNLDLMDEVRDRNKELMDSNHELVEKNNQLEQFAFMAAHNLRSPVARILGLGNLLPMTLDDPETQIIFKKLMESAVELDQVLHDLTAILEFKKGLGRFQEVILAETIEKVQRLLKTEIENSEAIIHSDFSKAPIIRAVPQYIESIFYNLLSNAIKYKSQDRVPEIGIQSDLLESQVVILFYDNGMGIDLNQFGDKIFGMYRRFHDHVEGKGLGLHMVKIQVEALNGSIKVYSQVGEGTRFEISLPLYREGE